MKLLTTLSLIAFTSAAGTVNAANETAQFVSSVKRAPVIDGVSTEKEWPASEWRNIDFAIIGKLPEADDFSGRYRLLWDKDYLYLNVQVNDNVLFDAHPNPLHKYWDDDCVEIFIDEDASGGEHLNNFNAFAYHIALDGNVADIGPEKANGDTNFILLNEHVNNAWTRSQTSPYTTNWEVSIELHNDTFLLEKTSKSSRVSLHTNKEIGFMLAYCDNDGSEERESFIGSHAITPVKGDMNLGYKTADVFGKIKLKD